MPASRSITNKTTPIKELFPTPYWSLPGARIYLGDVRDCLRKLPARSVHCCVTSPPYWALRDYGTCLCVGYRPLASENTNSTLVGSGNLNQRDPDPDCELCKGTGRTISKEVQIGCEPSPDCGTHGRAQCGQCFVCSMVSVFHELKRVLRDDGTLWLNLGDTYSTAGGGGPQNGLSSAADRFAPRSSPRDSNCQEDGRVVHPKRILPLPQGNLVGVPWRTALALQANGWILRQDVIWSKPNPMPESVTNRCTKSHEYIFMLTKSDDYYFDQFAIARDATPAMSMTTPRSGSYRQAIGKGVTPAGNGVLGKAMRTGDTANKHSVWTVPTKPGVDTHFATFSTDLITPCILAGTSEYGCCRMCSKSWERMVVKNDDESKETVGWNKVCGCRDEQISPCIVMDPFVGSGTTVVAAINLGRHGIGIDVSAPYLDEHAIPRIRASIVGGAVRKRPAPAPPRDTSLAPGKVEGI